MSAPQHIVVDSLRVHDAAGNPKGAELSGKVRLDAGPGVRLSRNGDEITITVDPSSVVHDADALAKYEAIVAGESGYSGAPYYVSAFNGLTPVDGNVFLLGGDTFQVGLFEDGVHPGGDPGGGSRGEPVGDYGLHLFDMGLPDVDCEDFQKVFANMERLRDFLEDARVKIAETPEDDPEYYGVIRQLEALIRHWHYMAARMCVSLAVRAVTSQAEAYLAINASYVNMSGNVVPPGVKAVVLVNGPRGVFSKDSVNYDSPNYTTLKEGTTKVTFEFTESLGVGERINLRFKYNFSALTIPAGEVATVTSQWSSIHVPDTLELVRRSVLEEWENPDSSVAAFERKLQYAVL